MAKDKHRNYIFLQKHTSDCEAACLLSIIKYYNGYTDLETIKKYSGSSLTGHKLLGLYHLATTHGFNAEICEADIASLFKHQNPIILHVLINDNIDHFVVYFGTKIKKNNELIFIIGDPSKGILYLSEVQLSSIWNLKICLTLKPNNNFILNHDIKSKKIKFIIQLIKEDIHYIILSFLLAIAMAVIGITMIILSQRLIDDIFPKTNFTLLNFGIGLFFLLLIIKEVVSSKRKSILLRQAMNFNKRLMSRLYAKLFNLPNSYFENKKIGGLIDKIFDTSMLQKGMSLVIGNIANGLIITFFVFIALLSYSWKISFFLIFILPVNFISIYFLKKHFNDNQRNISDSLSMNQSNFISTLMEVNQIKKYNKQELFTYSNDLMNGNYQDTLFKSGKMQLKIDAITNNFNICFFIVVLLYTSHQVLTQNIKIGEFMAILGLSSTLLSNISNLTLLTIPIYDTKIAFKRTFELNEIFSESQNDTIDLNEFNELRLEKVFFKFTGCKHFLFDISFEIKKGEMILFFGENGSGKTTLIQIIAKNYEVDNGNIFINEDYIIQHISYDSWKKLVGIISHQTYIFSGTVLYNIAFEESFLNPEKVLHFILEHGFDKYFKNLPQSHNTILGDDGITISDSQKQMIVFARTLFHKPQLLILDDATAIMDKKSEQFIMKLLKKLKSQMGVIFISNRLHFNKKVYDRVYFIKNGTTFLNQSH